MDCLSKMLTNYFEVWNKTNANQLPLSDALNVAVCLMKLFSEVMFTSNSKIPIEVVIDNKSLFKEKRN